MEHKLFSALNWLEDLCPIPSREFNKEADKARVPSDTWEAACTGARRWKLEIL